MKFLSVSYKQVIYMEERHLEMIATGFDLSMFRVGEVIYNEEVEVEFFILSIKKNILVARTLMIPGGAQETLLNRFGFEIAIILT